MISVMIPSRNAATQFKECLASLRKYCSDMNKVEIVVKLDSDSSPDFLPYRAILESYRFKYKIIISERHNGYPDMYIFWNNLAAMSSGDLLWMMNDDILLMGGDWVKSFSDLVEASNKRAFIIYPSFYASPSRYKKNKISRKANGWPVISRGFYNAIGHICPWGACCDRYIRDVSQLSKTSRIDPNVRILHNVSRRDPNARTKGGLKRMEARFYKGSYAKMANLVTEANGVKK